MQGTVWEWVEDAWHDNYDGAPKDGSAWTSGDPDYRVARGGSWRNDTSYLRAAAREKSNINVRFDTLRFRVAVSFGSTDVVAPCRTAALTAGSGRATQSDGTRNRNPSMGQ